jgi:hypothetical protein
MKAIYYIDPTLNIVSAARYGTVTVGETIDLIGTILADGRFRQGMSLVYDLTESESDWSLSEIDRLRTFIEKVGRRFGAGRWAFISKGGATEATVRILILLHSSGRAKIAMGLFRTKFEALKWVNTPDDGGGSVPQRDYGTP